MNDEKELVERLREARETISSMLAESPVSYWGWADRFIVLRALKQRGDYAAFVDLRYEEDYLRWVEALRQQAAGTQPRSTVVGLWLDYIRSIFAGSDPTIDWYFPADLMNDILALLNRPSLTAAWRSRGEGVREYIRQCAERAMLVDMDLLSPRKRQKNKKTQHFLSF